MTEEIAAPWSLATSNRSDDTALHNAWVRRVAGVDQVPLVRPAVVGLLSARCPRPSPRQTIMGLLTCLSPARP